MEDGKVFTQIIATYELCVFPPIEMLFHKAKPADCYIYAEDGETILQQDCYGQPIKEASLAEVIERLENLSDSDKAYRRVPPLLALLRGFQETESEWTDGELAVLHYGH